VFGKNVESISKRIGENCMSKENELIVVYAGTLVDANFVKSLLEGDGITVFLKDELMGTIAPWHVDLGGGVAAVKVMVAERDFERARDLIQHFLNERADDHEEE
jgi:hypothetical protein